MTKMEKEYAEEYGHIPKDYEGRLEYLLNQMNLTKLKEPVYENIKYISNIKWKTISYTIYLLPKATPRPRSGRNGIFYVKGASDNKKFFKKYIDEENVEVITTPCKFTCISYFPIPKSMNNLEKIAAELGFVRPISKPDKLYCSCRV